MKRGHAKTLKTDRALMLAATSRVAPRWWAVKIARNWQQQRAVAGES